MRVVNYYTTFFKEDFITKFLYKNAIEVISLNKITLRFSIPQTSIKNLLPLMTALFLMTDQKPYLKQQKRFYIQLKTKAGVAINCKVDLGKYEKFWFLEKFIFFVKPRMKNFSYEIKKKVVNFSIENAYLFKELEKGYEYIQDLPILHVSFVFNTEDQNQINSFMHLMQLGPIETK